MIMGSRYSLLSDEYAQRLTMQQHQTHRRHSVNVPSLVHLSDIRSGPPPASGHAHGTRRQSISESLQNITKSVQSSLHKALTLGSNVSLDGNGRNKFSKSFFREVLSTHFRQPDLKVTKVSVRSHPSPSPHQTVHEAEVWIKDARSRRKLELTIKAPNNGPHSISSEEDEKDIESARIEMEREYKVYSEVVADMCEYLRKKKIKEPDVFMSLPTRYAVVTDSLFPHDALVEGSAEDVSPPAQHDFTSTLILDNLSDFQMARFDRDEVGLDLTHSVLALARLARFHAVSYSMKKEVSLDFRLQYPFLAEDPVYNSETEESFQRTQANLATRLHNIFQQEKDIKKFSSFFLDSVKHLHSHQKRTVTGTNGSDIHGSGTNGTGSHDFEVLCHGDLWRNNVLYSYGTTIESTTDCYDVRFDDLHQVRYASCVTDILYLLFTTVDPKVRRDHTLNLLAVYQDHFSKTVKKLCPRLTTFSLEELVQEYKAHLMFGFLEGMCHFSNIYESQIRESMELSDADLDLLCGGGFKYKDYKNAVVAMMNDVVLMKLQENVANNTNE